MRARIGIGAAACLAVAGLLVGPTLAGGGGRLPERPERSSDATAAKSAILLDELRILRALREAGLKRETLQSVGEVVEDGYGQLEQGDGAAAKELAAERPLLDRPKEAFLKGEGSASPTEEEVKVAGTQVRLGNNRRQFLQQLEEAVRKLLEALPPEERAAAHAAGAALVRARRAEELADFLARGPEQGRGDTARDLEQLRRAGGPDYDRARLRFALRTANVPNWQRVPGLNDDDDDGNGPAPDLNDPQLQARIAPYQQLADRVRNMTPAQFAQVGAQIAHRAEAERRQARINAPVDEGDAREELAEALVRPGGRAALRSKLGAPVGGRAEPG